jgi:hypothetical protein
MKTLTTLFALAILSATSYGQTIKTLGYNTTNGHVVYSGTNALTFTNTLIQVNGVVYSETLVLSGTNGIIFDEGEAAATTRTNLGIPLPALTNTNNADTMQALAGSTNAGEPYSGSLEFVNATEDVFVVQISNGIILSVQEQ